jgi:hypothetical protein
VSITSVASSAVVWCTPKLSSYDWYCSDEIHTTVGLDDINKAIATNEKAASFRGVTGTVRGGCLFEGETGNGHVGVLP